MGAQVRACVENHGTQERHHHDKLVVSMVDVRISSHELDLPSLSHRDILMRTDLRAPTLHL